jgi:SAM-dependent methyltransferase
LDRYILKLRKNVSANLSMPASRISAEELIFESVKEVMRALEDDVRVSTRRNAVSGLRQLSLDDFGLVLLSMPNPEYPKLSQLLFSMASEEVQRNWTGNYGVALLKETTAFVRALRYHFMRITGRQLDNATVLDFGCGYGRIAQLIYYFTDENKLYAVDPSIQAIELCRESGLRTNFAVSEYLPTFLPVGEERFDVIYAFSVFTHLSRRAMTTSLGILQKYLKEDGMLAITIRPVEYWKTDPHTSREQKENLAARHCTEGFAFNPHNWEPIDGDVIYGDSSMSLTWIKTNFPEWKIEETDRNLNDPLQQYVFMRLR